jgi:AraC-like DNA-binding protein
MSGEIRDGDAAQRRNSKTRRRDPDGSDMIMPKPPLDRLMPASSIVAELTQRTPQPGPNASGWAGLTLYRFTSPQPPQWDDVGSLALCFVAQGRKAVRINDTEYRYDPFHYFVVNRGTRFQTEILEASTERPFLSLVLQIDPIVVRQVIADMCATTAMVCPTSTPDRSAPDAYVSPVEPKLTDAVLRLLCACDTDGDRRILAPMYLRETVYRLLQAEQCHRLIGSATSDLGADVVRAAIDYVHENPDRPVTVNDLAGQVYMSPSAFAHRFRESIGISPYQFVKNVRLEWARAVLLQDRISIREAASKAGYASPSHFISEFKRRYGVTPRKYTEQHAGTVPLRIGAVATRPQRSTDNPV